MIIYMDDIVIGSETIGDHINHLAITFHKLELAGITISPKKCKFGYTELHALGNKVTGLQLGISDNHISAVKDWPAPHDLKSLRQWLGFTGFHCSKVQNYSIIAAPLYDLLRKDTPYQWTIQRQKAFNDLKALLASSPVIKHPSESDPFRLYLDACLEGLGGALYQIQNGKEAAICFISRQLKESEKRYGATQLECLALVWALEKLHFYLDGAQFTIYTDCEAIRSLVNLKTPSRHMLRWQLAIQEYRNGMTLVHRAGKQNQIADALSRAALPNDTANPAADLTDEIEKVSDNDLSDNYLPISSIMLLSIHNELFEFIKDSYSKDPIFSIVYNCLTNNIDTPSVAIANLPAAIRKDFDAGRYFLLDKLLYRKSGLASSLVVTDKGIQTQILESCHDELSSGHLALDRTLESVKRIAWWPTLSDDTNLFVSTCKVCQRSRRHTGKIPGLLQKIESPKHPWEIINMDFVTGLPPAGPAKYNSILLIVDRFSKMTFFVPTHENATAHDTAYVFWHNCWSRTGLPKIIISDRDPKFTSEFWRSLHGLLGTKLAFSTAHHPQTDGLAERNIMTLEDLLRRFVAFGIEYKDASGLSRDWYSILPALQMAYNSTVHATTKRSPFELERGYLPLSPKDFISQVNLPLKIDPIASDFKLLLDTARSHAADCINAAFEYSKKRWDQTHTEITYKPGDQVYISTKHFKFSGPRKLHEPFVGPFTVLRHVGPNAIEVNLTKEFNRRHPVFPISLTKPHKSAEPDRFPKRTNNPPPVPDLIDGEEEYEIESIVKHRTIRTKGKKPTTEYLVRWKGYDESEDLWLPESSFANAPDILQEYIRTRTTS